MDDMVTHSISPFPENGSALGSSVFGGEPGRFVGRFPLVLFEQHEPKPWHQRIPRLCLREVAQGIEGERAEYADASGATWRQCDELGVTGTCSLRMMEAMGILGTALHLVGHQFDRTATACTPSAQQSQSAHHVVFDMFSRGQAAVPEFRTHHAAVLEVSAYYAGEAPEVVEARKTWFVPGARSAIPGHEDCYFFKTIKIPYDKRQQLLVVDIFECEPTPKMDIPDDLIGRATMPLADPRLEQPAEWPLARGPWEFVGTVTVSVEFPAPEDKVWPLPDIRDFPEPVSPRDFTRSKDKGKGLLCRVWTALALIPFSKQFPHSRLGPGAERPWRWPLGRTEKSIAASLVRDHHDFKAAWRCSNRGFGLNPKVDNIWTFDSGCGGYRNKVAEDCLGYPVGIHSMGSLFQIEVSGDGDMLTSSPPKGTDGRAILDEMRGIEHQQLLSAPPTFHSSDELIGRSTTGTASGAIGTWPLGVRGHVNLTDGSSCANAPRVTVREEFPAPEARKVRLHFADIFQSTVAKLKVLDVRRPNFVLGQALSPRAGWWSQPLETFVIPSRMAFRGRDEVLESVDASADFQHSEAPEVVEARKTWFVPGARSAIPGHEDCYFFKTIEIPYDKRQQLLVVDIFECEPTPKMDIPDDLIGRATMPLADPRLEQPAEWPLARGPWEFVGTVTVSVEFPAPEDKVWPLPDIKDFPAPVSPRDFARSKDKGGIDMSPFDQPRTVSTLKSSGGGGIDMSPFDQPRSRSNSKSSGGSSPTPVWVPVLNGPGGGFGLNPKVDNMWTFDSGCGGPVKCGTMSPLPSFSPEWFTAKLPPGTPAPRPLPPSAFQPPPVPPGLMAQIPVLATVPPAVAAMVVEALRAPPLTTATMPAPPASVLQAGPLPYLPSIAPPYCGGYPWRFMVRGEVPGGPNLSGFVAPTVFHAPVARGRNMCCVVH
ncbi:unnamed protein product [Cladocopium goreaui]|uniref:Protein HID1 n=1 Tax=Cladocopium goreaui TaxID=2562237 RepID=A0A9P1CB97_9DINO|nr:unnamed protein product [Cladocopium goreaui]